MPRLPPSRNWAITWFPRDQVSAKDVDYWNGLYEEIKQSISSSITYCGGQVEATKADDYHWQGVLILRRQQRMAATKKLLSMLPNCHIEQVKDMEALREYINKDESKVPHFPRLEIGKLANNSERISAARVAKKTGLEYAEVIQCGSKDERANAIYEELFKSKNLELKAIELAKTAPATIHQQNLIKDAVKVRRAYERVLQRREAVKDAQLRPWQKTLYDELRREPDDRKIIVYQDTRGNTGKSWFVKWYGERHPYDSFSMTNGRSSDIQHQLYTRSYNNKYPRVVFVDMTRSRENADRDMTNYESWEFIKNSKFLSTKYTGGDVSESPCHLVIFCNQHPDYGKLSLDRWDIRCMDKGKVTYMKLAETDDGKVVEVFPNGTDCVNKVYHYYEMHPYNPAATLDWALEKPPVRIDPFDSEELNLDDVDEPPAKIPRIEDDDSSDDEINVE